MIVKKELELEKMDLDDSEESIIERMSENSTSEVKLIKKIIIFHLDRLRNIMLIDNKGNVGLQTCSRQEAYNALDKMFQQMFPTKQDPVKKSTEKKISTWQ